MITFFLLEPSFCVIQYKLKDYSVQSEQNK